MADPKAAPAASGTGSTGQVDDNQDDLGRDVNAPQNRIGDKATADKAHELSRKIGLERGYKRDPDDPASAVSGGFNQKSKI